MNSLKRTILIGAIAANLISCGIKKNDIEEADLNIGDVEYDIKDQNDSELEVSEEYTEINWEHYRELMDYEDQVVFQEYLSVLKNDEKFYCFDWCNKEVTFNEYLSSIVSERKPDIQGVTLVDLDNQNGKELIICLYEGGGNYLILTRDTGKIYGTNLGARQFEDLQKDGKYYGAGGAGDLYFCTLAIDSAGLKVNRFGEVHGEDNEEGSHSDRLEVNGQVINQSLKDWLEENYNDPVDWIK